jgi:hypothetical protein
VTRFFASTSPGTEVTLLGRTYELPILYFRDDVFGLFFAASADAVRKVLPSDRLHPVRLPGGRALVGIVAFNYLETTIGPYGEVAVVALAVHDRRPKVPGLPALLEASYPGFGMVVLHLPVTTLIARDGGRGQWGYTKFTSDMRFQITPGVQQCRMSEGGRHILTLRVERGGFVRRDTKPLVTYSVLDGNLIRTEIPHRSTYRMKLRPKASFLALGDHPVAATITDLGLGKRPLMTRYFVERSAILPAGEVVEEGVRPLEGYRGEENEGSLEIDYLGGES